MMLGGGLLSQELGSQALEFMFSLSSCSVSTTPQVWLLWFPEVAKF